MCRRRKPPELTGPVLGIATAWQYWAEVAQPSVLAYLADSTPRTAFGACMALWHLHDWVEDERVEGADAILSSSHVKVVRDVITWGKHKQVCTSQGAISGVTESLDGMRLMAGPGYPLVTEHLATFTVQFADGRTTPLATVVQRAYEDWATFFAKQGTDSTVS